MVTRLVADNRAEVIRREQQAANQAVAAPAIHEWEGQGGPRHV